MTKCASEPVRILLLVVLEWVHINSGGGGGSTAVVTLPSSVLFVFVDFAPFCFAILFFFSFCLLCTCVRWHRQSPLSSLLGGREVLKRIVLLF